MADVITRLKVESSEYDSKIQRAAKGLLHMEEACRKVGGTLAVLEDDEKKFVQSLGSMQTVATTVRGKLNELTQAYTELSVQYKRLTDEEKQGDFGKALSASLDQLKTRINDVPCMETCFLYHWTTREARNYFLMGDFTQNMESSRFPQIV